MEQIAKIVAEYYGIDLAILFTRNRTRNVVKARAMIMLFARISKGLTFADLGAFFDRDHATAIHALSSIETEIQVNKITKSEYKDLKTLLFEVKVKSAKEMKFCNRQPFDLK